MNKVLLTFLVADFFFLATGGLLAGVALVTRSELSRAPTLENVARNMLLVHCPLTGAIVNAVFIAIAFIASLPGLALPTNRSWLKVHGWLVVFCACFSLILGLDIWFRTLKTRANLGSMWGQESQATQALLQEKFNCCGYLNSITPPFQTSNICPNPLVAAQRQGCVGPFSNFANGYLSLIFTASFGIVALDVILILCVAMVLKDRWEQQRYRHIDEKNGIGRI